MSISRRERSVVAINSAMTKLMRRIRRIDETSGVGRARLSALAVLHFGGSCTMTELADTEMVSAATMHHVVKGLVNDGMARTRVDRGDRRRRLIVLTPAGRRVIEKAHRARIDYLSSLVTDHDDALQQAADVLRHLNERAHDDDFVVT